MSVLHPVGDHRPSQAAVTHAYGGNTGGVFRLHRGLTWEGCEEALLPLGLVGRPQKVKSEKKLHTFLSLQLVGGYG